MPTNSQKVELIMRNRPGALDRVIGFIRREGWNIKSLQAGETENPSISLVEMEIEGTNTKLVQIVEKFSNIDCVRQASMTVNGEVVVKRKAQSAASLSEDSPEKVPPVPEKPQGVYRILTINPGSTSTKFAVYDDERLILLQVLRHRRRDLDACGTVLGQKNVRLQRMLEVLALHRVPLESLDAIAGRGGLLRPIESGVYRINAAMLADLHTASASVHASALGAIIARELADRLSIEAYIVDPVVVDELDPAARITGMPGIERISIFHALNHKEIARRFSTKIGKPYETLRLVVAHMGGGISVGAHRYGRVIDVNDGLSGEGPFTPERSGGVPALPLIKMCYSGEYTEQEMMNKVTRDGGMQSYIGTNDAKAAEKMIAEGDEFASLVVDSMAYQVAKEIGAMVAVLEGRVDAIVLTGGLAYSNRFTGSIKQRVDALAPVYVYPGEDEMLALRSGVLRVLKGKARAMEYTL